MFFFQPNISSIFYMALTVYTTTHTLSVIYAEPKFGGLVLSHTGIFPTAVTGYSKMYLVYVTSISLNFSQETNSFVFSVENEANFCL